MSPAVDEAELAAAIATSLCASGVDARPMVDDDGSAWIALVLDERAGTFAFLVVSDMSYAVMSDVAGVRRLIADGPLAGLERCDSARCVASQILTWVLARRAGMHR